MSKSRMMVPERYLVAALRTIAECSGATAGRGGGHGTGQNLTDELSCGTRYSLPHDQALSLRNPVTGGTVLRCTLSEPRTFQIAAKINFR